VAGPSGCSKTDLKAKEWVELMMVTGGGLAVEGLSTVGVAVGSQSCQCLALETVAQKSSVTGRGSGVKEISSAGVTAVCLFCSTVTSSVKE
jgi:hypothetical protein